MRQGNRWAASMGGWFVATFLTLGSVGALAQTSASGTQLPSGYWAPARSQTIVQLMQTVRLAPDLRELGDGERRALAKLLEVGEIFQNLYEQQRHAGALAASAELSRLRSEAPTSKDLQDLSTLYELFKGPIAITTDNQLEAFLPVDLPPPGRAVYPTGITRQEIDSFMAAHPQSRATLLHPRTVVRRADESSLRADLAQLRRWPALPTLHPGLQRSLEEGLASPDPMRLYAVPYAVAYANEMMRAHALLNEAAVALEEEDPEFAGYLRNRSRDLLSNDYESGDAAWVTGHFKHLNAQIGSYESYDDELYGAKTFFGMSVVSIRARDTADLRRGAALLQSVEDELPSKTHKKVREEIPIGVYDVVADFGEARGGNTATILPNETQSARRYGRTILMRSNMIRTPAIFEVATAAWTAVVQPSHAAELSADGAFDRLVWHEIGHYVGVDARADGQSPRSAFGSDSLMLEELKADLVSLYAAQGLHRRGLYSDAQLRQVYASGIQRCLLNIRPRRQQPYQTMELMQWNFFLEEGLLNFDPTTGRLGIRYDKYHEAVGRMLSKVLDLQYEGTRAAADAFIEHYARWDEAVQGVTASKMRATQRFRYRLFKYAALGD
jgi:hypothetical protein